MPCSECNFFQPVTAPVCLPRSQRFGECRRHPPKNVGAPLHRENQTHAVFPIVSEDDWCGEFVSTPGKKLVAPSVLGQRYVRFSVRSSFG